MTCRICLEDEGEMIQPCNCKGTSANVHPDCLVKWLNISQKTECEICKFQYSTTEIEITRHTCFPPFRLAEEITTRRVVIIFGAVLCMITQMEGLAFPDMLDAVFICTNVVITMFILGSQCLCGDINILETLSYWKLCTLIGFISLAFFLGDWTYAKYEGILFGTLVMLTYLHLVGNESRRTMTHIEVII